MKKIFSVMAIFTFAVSVCFAQELFNTTLGEMRDTTEEEVIDLITPDEAVIEVVQEPEPQIEAKQEKVNKKQKKEKKDKKAKKEAVVQEVVQEEKYITPDEVVVGPPIEAKQEKTDKQQKKDVVVQEEKYIMKSGPGTMSGKVLAVTVADMQKFLKSKIVVVDDNGTEWAFSVNDKTGFSDKNKAVSLDNIKENDMVQIKYSEIGVRVYEAIAINKD